MKSFYSHLKYLLFVYAIGIVFFAFFRLALLFSQWEQLSYFPDNFIYIANAFLMGFRFDTVISMYILILPLVVLLLSSVLGVENKKIVKGSHIYICSFYALSLFLCIADIPYFEEFFKHINASVLNWKDEKSFVFTMIVKDKNYLLYFFFALLISALYVWIVTLSYKKIYKNYTNSIHFIKPIKESAFKFLLFVLVMVLVFLGIRGRIALKSPIRVGTAYFSNYAFPNQLSLNPIFYFINSTIEEKKKSQEEIHLMSDKDALEMMRSFYHVLDSLNSPLARCVKVVGKPKKYNVVLVMMESLSAELLNKVGANKELVPFLDSLSNHSVFFDNYYTAGIHTMNGIYSSLFSYPALFNQHPMKTVDMLFYDGFPYELKKNGYHTAYFTTHDDQFDNVGGFLSVNGVELIQAQKDYPMDKVKSNLGVPDDYMFERAIPTINKMHEQGKPFFAAMLTASYHTPYVIPDYYSTSYQDIKEEIIKYSDWSLRKFFEMAKKQEWYKNTIFVLTADHGSIHGKQLYDISLSRHHSPLIIIAPDLSSITIKQVASQLDIFPTVMGLLNIPYINNTFGVDLLKERREYALLNSDDIVACISDSLLYVYSAHGDNALYRYKTNETKNIINEYPQQALTMKDFMFSTMQSAQYLIKNNLTNVDK
jgi:phosphoglycerol transferase MdoB-like AlkP superfamily enzyme